MEGSISPTVSPFTELKYSQPVKNLYPQISKDNPLSDPKPALSHAKSSLIGQIDVNDSRNSITRKTKEDLLLDANVGLGIESIESSDANTHTINTTIDHGLNSLVKVTINNAGTNYGTLSGDTEVYYNAKLVGGNSNGKHATERLMGQPEIHWLTVLLTIPSLFYFSRSPMLLHPIVGTRNADSRRSL